MIRLMHLEIEKTFYVYRKFQNWQSSHIRKQLSKMSSILICVLLKLNLGWHSLYCTVAPPKGQLISKGTIQVLLHQRGGWVGSENGNF